MILLLSTESIWMNILSKGQIQHIGYFNDLNYHLSGQIFFITSQINVIQIKKK